MKNEQTPRKQIITALSELDILKSMKTEAGFNKSSAAELEAEMVETISRILTSHPELENNTDPIMARAFSLKALSTKARAAKQSVRFPAKSAEPHLTSTIYDSLNEHSKKDVDGLYLDLLDEQILDEMSIVVKDSGEASKHLGLHESQLERAYGLLSAIDDQPAPDDIIEFVAINFERPESNGGNPVPDGDGPSSQQGRYLGRVRKSSEEAIISIVLDAVPYVENNAVYVLRNDDDSIISAEESFTSKKKALENGARRVFHRKETGEAGVVKRINKLLLMPFDTFQRTEQE